MDLVREAINQVERCLKVAEAFFNRPFILANITFGLTGGVSGKVLVRDGQYEIQINRAYLESNPERILKQTIPHEVAHLVSFQHYGARIKPHGDEWKQVMVEVFKLKPDRCHSMELPVETRPFTYRCACRDFFVSERKHDRMKDSAHRCNTCKQVVDFVGRREEKPAIIAERLLIYTSTGKITLEQLKRVKKLLSGAKVENVVLHGVSKDCDGAVTRVAKALEASPPKVQHHPTPSTVPAGCSHAVFFLDTPSAGQKAALEALRAKGVRLRVLSPSRPG